MEKSLSGQQPRTLALGQVSVGSSHVVLISTSEVEIKDRRQGKFVNMTGLPPSPLRHPKRRLLQPRAQLRKTKPQIIHTRCRDSFAMQYRTLTPPS